MREQLSAPRNGMSSKDRLQVLEQLVPAMANLGQSRYSGTKDVQGSAIDLLAKVIDGKFVSIPNPDDLFVNRTYMERMLHDADAAKVVNQMLDKATT